MSLLQRIAAALAGLVAGTKFKGRWMDLVRGDSTRGPSAAPPPHDPKERPPGRSE